MAVQKRTNISKGLEITFTVLFLFPGIFVFPSLAMLFFLRMTAAINTAHYNYFIPWLVVFFFVGLYFYFLMKNNKGKLDMLSQFFRGLLDLCIFTTWAAIYSRFLSPTTLVEIIVVAGVIIAIQYLYYLQIRRVKLEFYIALSIVALLAVLRAFNMLSQFLHNLLG